MSELGSGLSLDSQWDLYVDESNGDLSFSDGGAEVRKDLAFQLTRLLRNIVGDYVDDGKLTDIGLAVQRLVVNEPRIDEVQRLQVDTPTSRRDRIEVDIVAITIEDEVIDDVFTVTT